MEKKTIPQALQKSVLDTIWHDVSETPEANSYVIVIIKYLQDDYTVAMGFVVHRENHWELQCLGYIDYKNIQKWAYTEDLMPTNKDKLDVINQYILNSHSDNDEDIKDTY